MCGCHEPSIVAPTMEKAMAKTLRSFGGVPWLSPLADAVSEAWRLGSTRPVEDFLERLAVAEMTGGRAAFADAARSLAAVGAPVPSGKLLPDDGDPAHLLAVAGLRRMAWRLCLGGLEPQLVGTTFDNAGAFRSYTESCLDAVQVEKLARRLEDAKDPRRITAPRSLVKRRTTAELMDVSVL